MKFLALLPLALAAPVSGKAQCRAIKWQPDEVEFFRSLYTTTPKSGVTTPPVPQDPDARDERRNQQIASGLGSIASRTDAAPCLQQLWLKGATGYFWLRDADAKFHTLSPEDGHLALALQCISKDWLLSQAQSRLRLEHPKALRAKRFKLDTQFRRKYEDHLAIVEILAPASAAPYFTELMGEDMKDWGGLYYHNRVESSPDDPLILKYLDYLHGQAADPASPGYLSALADYQGALIYRQYIKKDGDELYKALMLRPAGWVAGLNDLHELKRDDLVDRFLSEAKLSSDELGQVKRTRESYNNGEYDRRLNSPRASKKWECPRPQLKNTLASHAALLACR